MDRLETIAVGAGIEQGQPLAAMSAVGGVVDVERDLARNVAKTVAEQIDQLQPHVRQRPPARQIFQPRQGRLRSQPQGRVR